MDPAPRIIEMSGLNPDSGMAVLFKPDQESLFEMVGVDIQSVTDSAVAKEVIARWITDPPQGLTEQRPSIGICGKSEFLEGFETILQNSCQQAMLA